ncbi:extracellular solute-binding protein [Mahella sp.]|uniref:extracellular solute-binding protein n=1 Tax=Mahella sp. TaxID=2798721 RepID=UPI0025C53015|nr:extracellular solute-binding protein [Mahella sp.]MBZ4665293.1 transporter substrate-binding protein [Mahella sp.]
MLARSALKNIFSLVIILMFIIMTFNNSDALADPLVKDNSGQSAISDVQKQSITEKSYSEALSDWVKEGILYNGSFETTVQAYSFISGNAALKSEQESQGHDGKTLYFDDGNSATFEILVDKDGLYELGFEYYPMDDSILDIENEIMVNGQYQYQECRKIVFPVEWKYIKESFELDRHGNQILPRQIKIKKWYYTKAKDLSGLRDEPLKFYLKEGYNTITLVNTNGQFLLGKLYIRPSDVIPTYREYRSMHNVTELLIKEQNIVSYEAEKIASKSSPSVRALALRDVNVVPYNLQKDMINIIDGQSWLTHGDTINWTVDVEEYGYYKLAFKVRQNYKANVAVFRNLYIDGEIPFAEVRHYKFKYDENWYNEILSAQEGQPYEFFLTEGKHIISLEVDASLYSNTMENINRIMNEINDLALEIKKLTGNKYDPNRDWSITDYIPDLVARMDKWQSELDANYKYIQQFELEGRSSEAGTTIKLAIDQLERLKAEPDELPNRLEALSDGSASVAQYLGNLFTLLQEQPLDVDRFYLFQGNELLPSANVGLGKQVDNWAKRFLSSFGDVAYYSTETAPDELEVWVNRPVTYVELLQKMTDSEFTPDSGIKVKFSVMPDEQKLVLASAAGEQPDIALGINYWRIYDLAVRGAALDLNQFTDFNDIIKDYAPGAMLPLIIDDKAYGLPETQDFWVLFYRKDIMSKLTLEIPDTMDDVLKLLPELQRYGMNFYVPLAGQGGLKPFPVTVPFIYQFGGELYASDGMSAAIDQENALKGIKFMSDIFTVYSMPMQVPNFYNSFRYGILPIGISNFGTYIQLLTAAPELRGLWDIAPYPGIKSDNGTVERWAPGLDRASMIFARTDESADAWRFIKWWSSADVQVEYAVNLQATYGKEYMWNTANLKAFSELPWNPDHKNVILEQWQWLKEAPRIPGFYMMERELGNIWNRIVFEGENFRNAVDDSVIDINREIRKQMENLGYLRNGQIVKEYKIPSIDLVKSWMEEGK